MLRDSIGYVRLMGFGAYYPDRSYERQGEDRFAADLRALDAALDTIFASSAGWRGLVIDMRLPVTVVPVLWAGRSPAGGRRRLTRLMP